MSLTYLFLNTKYSFFKNSFFPSTIIEWKKLVINLIFKKHILLQFMRSSLNSVYNSHNPKGRKLMTRLCLGLIHLREHKFKHSFQDSINPLVTKLNLQFIFSSITVLCSQTKETFSLALYII